MELQEKKNANSTHLFEANTNSSRKEEEDEKETQTRGQMF